MASYAWKIGSWKAGALKSGSWGPEVPTSSAPPASGVPSFTTFSASPTSGTTSTPITFTFSVSGTPDGFVYIDPEGNGSYNVIVTAGQSATFTYTSAGNFTAQALVSGAGGNATITFGVISINEVVSPGPSFAGGGRSGLRFATLDAGGLGGLRSSKSLLAYGLKRRT